MKSQINKLVDLFSSNDLVNYELGFQLMKGLRIPAEEIAELCWDKWGVIGNTGSGVDIKFLFPNDLILSSLWVNINMNKRSIEWDHIEVYERFDPETHLFKVEDIDENSQEEIKQAMIKASIFIINKCLEYVE